MELTNLANAVNELEAAKKRVERDARTLESATKKKLVADLLPVLDSLDRMIAAEEIAVEGAKHLRAQLEGVLLKYGVERFDARGTTFDPKIHDAIAIVPAHALSQHDEVVDQIEPGYRFEGTLLRPAKVVVAQLRA